MLHVAACHGQLDIVRFLLLKNADPMALDHQGHTAAQLAAKEDKHHVVAFLNAHVPSNIATSKKKSKKTSLAYKPSKKQP